MRIALLIADSDLTPFPAIRAFQESEQGPRLRNAGVDLFFAKGMRNPSLWSELVNTLDGRWRYTELGPVINQLTAILVRKSGRIPSQVFQQGNTLFIDTPEGLPFLGNKIISSMRYLFDQGYDFVLRTTLSSLFRIEALVEVVSKFSITTPVYAGRLVKQSKNTIFVSGSFLILNRPAFDLIGENLNSYDYAHYDDVAIGRLISKLIQPHFFPSIDVSSLLTLNEQELGKSNAVHFRCKSNDIPRTDVEILRSVSALL